MSVVEQIAAAITRMEGNGATTRATRNNNPGNIWDGLSPGKTQRIWPGLPIDAQGFVQYPTYADGYNALLRDLQIKVNRGMTLRQLITMYAPPKGDTVGGMDLSNNTEAYIRYVASQTGLPENTPLNQLASGGPAPADPTKTPHRS